VQESLQLELKGLKGLVGAAAATLMPLVEAIRTHVFAAERIHADDTTAPVLAKGKTRTGRLWAYVRDDRPFAGPGPPAAWSSIRATVAAPRETSVGVGPPGHRWWRPRTVQNRRLRPPSLTEPARQPRGIRARTTAVAGRHRVLG
jgi:Transposase IS66 family